MVLLQSCSLHATKVFNLDLIPAKNVDEKDNTDILAPVYRTERIVGIGTGIGKSAVLGSVASRDIRVEQWERSRSAGELHFPLVRLPVIRLEIHRRKGTDGYTTSTIITEQQCAHGYMGSVKSKLKRHSSYSIPAISPDSMSGTKDAGGFLPAGLAFVSNETIRRPLLRCLQVGEPIQEESKEYLKEINTVRMFVINCSYCEVTEDLVVRDRGIKKAQDLAASEDIDLWSRQVNVGGTLNILFYTPRSRIDESIPQSLWNRTVWNISRAANALGVTTQAIFKASGGAFCSKEALPITQVSNGALARVSRTEIVLAYASAFALILIQLKIGALKSLSQYRKRRSGSGIIVSSRDNPSSCDEPVNISKRMYLPGGRASTSLYGFVDDNFDCAG